MIYSFDVGKNFWKEHPDMKVAEPFKSIYASDKSKEKKDSSLMMWFIVLCYDRNSKYFKLMPDGEDGKHAVIGEDFCGDKDYYKKQKAILKAGIDMYIKLQYTPAERHLKTWEDKLDQRTALLEGSEYSLDNFETIDKLAVDTPKIMKALKDAKAALSEEASSGMSKGGSRKSLND